MCSFNTGTNHDSNNLQQWTVATLTTQCFSQELDVPHGTRIYTSVSCVNTVELETIEYSRYVIVSYEAPNATRSTVQFTVNSVTLQGQSQVQRHKSTLHFFWDFFHDISGMRTYQCRVKSGSSILSDWTDVGRHNYVTLSDTDMVDGEEYTAEVKGTNIGGLESKTIRANISINEIIPVLTGKSLE